MVNNKIKRCIPFLLALVVLISCLLAISVAAADYDCSSGNHDPQYLTISSSGSNQHTVYCDDCGTSWTEACSFSGLSCTNVGSCVCGNTSGPIDHVWSDGTVVLAATCTSSGSTEFTCSLCGETKSESIPILGHSWSYDGCIGTCSRCGVIDGSHGAEGFTYLSYSPYQHQTTCEDCGSWWYDDHSFLDDVCSLCGYQISYRSTITIDGESYWFVASDARPTVTLSVTATGASLTDGSETLTYTYSGEGTFQGLSYSATGAASLVPGESYPLAAGDHTLYAIASTSGDAEAFYTTTVVIDGGKFVFPGTAEASPDVSMTVTETGATLTYGTLTYHYPYTGSGVYLGLTLPGSSEIIYPIGTTATLSGADGADALFTLVPASASQTYTKVTQNLADWTGTYLIVYEVSETEGYVFTGVDEKLNSVLTQLADGNIVTSASDLAFCPVRIEPYGSGYSVKLLSGINVGKYVYASPSGYNDILFSDEPQQLTITHDGNNAYILDGEVPFQFNKSSSYLWFRFFGAKPGGQSEIALYKLYDGSDNPVPHYSITINLWNNAGTELLYSWVTYSLTDLSPKVSVFPYADGIMFSPESGLDVTYTGIADGFIGLSYLRLSTVPAIVLGQSITLGGEAQNTTVNLYCVYETGFADPSDTDFVSWLATAVGGFLDFELWPGMSLDQVLWVILVIGILMWFLKIIM